MREPLKPGDSFSGHTVAGVLGQSSRVEVFTTTDKQLRWTYLGNEGRIPSEMLFAVSRFDALMSQIRTQVPKPDREAAYEQLGKALFHVLDCNSPTECAPRYDPVQLFITECALRDSRLTYVVAFLISSVLIGAACSAAARWGSASETSPFLWAASCGVVGSGMSVLSRSGNLPLNANAGRTFLLLQGACRPILGALFGLFLTLACKGDVILSFAKNSPLALLSMATMAGFSERFVPEIMSRLEGVP